VVIILALCQIRSRKSISLALSLKSYKRWTYYVYLSLLPKYPSGFSVVYSNCLIKYSWTLPLYPNGTVEYKTQLVWKGEGTDFKAVFPAVVYNNTHAVSYASAPRPPCPDFTCRESRWMLKRTRPFLLCLIRFWFVLPKWGVVMMFGRWRKHELELQGKCRDIM
jgi:hypothetical protein